MAAGSLGDIRTFLSLKRIAVIGASRDEKSYSRLVMDELRRRGRTMIPVNPAAPQIAGETCYPRVSDIRDPVDGALIITPPAVTDAVVQECVAAGVRCLWVRCGHEDGAVAPETRALCAERQLILIEGYCPLMFLPETAFVHRVHGAFARLFGRYPRP